MARLRILPLPGDGHPFALVIDRVSVEDSDALGLSHAVPGWNPVDSFADRVGARTVLVFDGDLELPGDDRGAGADRLRARADELERLEHGLGFPVRESDEPVTLDAAQYRAAADVADTAP